MATFAIALYDNEAESDEELSFKKNDLLQVNQKDYMGMEGWWLCKLIRENKSGLAPGNRLKITNDEKVIAKLKNSFLLPNLSKSNKFNSIISTSSTSSSASSILSSSSSLSSTSNNQVPESNLSTRLQTLSLQQEQSTKLALPAKTNCKSNSLFKLNTDKPIPTPTKTDKNQDDEDYDYDIPENNRPVLKSTLNNEQENLSKLDRKSISPTIDSGISTSSLISLNSESLLNNQDQRISDYSSYECEISASKSGKFDFDIKMEKLQVYFDQFDSRLFNLNTEQNKKEKLINFEHFLHDLLSKNLKTLKQDHACFHPDLNTFNKFKTLYRQIKDFYLFYESQIDSFDRVYKWNFDIIDFMDLINKIKHLKTLIDQLKQLVSEKYLFEYQSDTCSFDLASRSQKQLEESEEYQYEYDNNNLGQVEFEQESDYCEIDPEEEERCLRESNSKKLESLVENGSCMTLRRNDEKIRREIRMATSSSSSETTRITLSDQMLLKFYLKHIEENFNDLKSIHDVLQTKLIDLESKQDLAELANKLALNGHKLVFISDTLQRNINNTHLKMSLFECSTGLCESLKLYMIRLKSMDSLACSKQRQLIGDSLQSVYSSADRFKQIVLKYFFNNF